MKERLKVSKNKTSVYKCKKLCNYEYVIIISEVLNCGIKHDELSINKEYETILKQQMFGENNKRYSHCRSQP